MSKSNMESKTKKKLSGAQNRKRQAEKIANIKKQSGSLNKYLKISTASEIAYTQQEPEPCTSSRSQGTVENIEQDFSKKQLSDNKVIVPISYQMCTNLEDPAEWNKIDDKLRVILVEMGPVQKKDIIYPNDVHGRKFSDVYYNRKMENGEVVFRKWLIYSEILNSVFCFCCKVFGSTESSLIEGYNNWRNLSTTLHRHETSMAHMKSLLNWNELEKRLKNKITIDCQSQNLYEMEKKHWRSVLERLIEIIKFLGSQNLAFRGSSDKLYEKNNGNFLKLIELFAKFDPVMENHVERALDQNNRVHYLSKDSQNELLEILSTAIRETILLSIKKSKYYSIILDCTPDASKTEQMTIIIRFVFCNNGTVKIRENFLGFIDITDSTGRGLCTTIIEQLEKWKIPIEDMRGQGYDNGANMKGKKAGLQNLILTKNPRAFYVPCAAHSLNLIINDAAKVNVDTIGFFAIVQKIYNFFSSSYKRWSILLKFIKTLTLKQPSETRWESRIDAIRPLRYQLGEIYDALYEIMNNESCNREIQHEAQSLCTNLKDYKFICSLIIWHDILNRINPVSKMLQNVNMNASLALESIANLNKFLREYRSDSNFKNILKIADELSEEVDGEKEFKTAKEVRQRKKTRQFDYEHQDETPQIPEEKFKINMFFTLLDVAINSLTERFELLEACYNNFNFLYKISEINKSELQAKCKDLENILKFDNSKDINATDLFDELCAFRDIFQKDFILFISLHNLGII